MASSTALCIAGVRNSHAINGASENQCGPKSGIRFTIATDSQNASIGLTAWHSSSFSTNERTCTEFRCARIRMLWNMRTPPPWTCKTGGYGVTTKICIFAKHRAHAGLGTVAAVYFLRLRAMARSLIKIDRRYNKCRLLLDRQIHNLAAVRTEEDVSAGRLPTHGVDKDELRCVTTRVDEMWKHHLGRRSHAHLLVHGYCRHQKILAFVYAVSQPDDRNRIVR